MGRTAGVSPRASGDEAASARATAGEVRPAESGLRATEEAGLPDGAPGVEPIRTLIVDDHALFRRGLEMVLEAEPDIELVGEASDGEEAVS